MAAAVIPIDVYVGGNLSAKTMTLPPAAVTDASVVGNAKIQSSKLQHRFEPAYSQPGASSAAAERKVVHVVKGTTGTILEFSVGARVAAVGAATVVFDLQKNGTTVLSGTITLDSTTAAYILKAGTVTSTALVAGDVLEVVVTSPTAGGGTLALGLFARVSLDEDAN